jgi:hypothetical protein
MDADSPVREYGPRSDKRRYPNSNHEAGSFFLFWSWRFYANVNQNSNPQASIGSTTDDKGLVDQAGKKIDSEREEGQLCTKHDKIKKGM